MGERKEHIKSLVAENIRLKAELEEMRKENDLINKTQLPYEETSFYQLFDEMNSASALHRMIFDEQGHPVDYVFIRVNKMFESLTGLKAEDIIGHSVLEVLPETEKYWIERYGEVVRSGIPVEFDNFARELDRYYSVRAYCPVKDHFIVTFTDVTEQKRAEIRMSKTKLFYEKILDTVHDGIGVTDQHDVIIYSNSAIEKIAGADKSNFIGYRILEDFSNEITGEFLVYYRKAKKLKKPIEYETNMVALDGRKTVQTGWMIPVIEDDKYKGMICSMQDITEKKKLDIELREHELKIQEIVENLNGIVYRCVSDEYWTMIFLSAGVQILTGYSPQEILENKTISFNDIIHPEDREMVRGKVLDSVFRNEKYKIEYRIVTKDQKEKWVYEQGSGIKAEDGTLSHLEGYIFDISDRKNMELEIITKNKEIAAQNEEYLTINEELQERIEQIQTINAELKKAKLKAEESDRLKSAFLANMSHEIRTPMNSIIGFSNLIVSEEIPLFKRKQFSQFISSSGEHLLRIIDDILDIAKIESNQLKIEMSDQNLTSLLNETYLYHLQSNLCKEKNLAFIFNTYNFPENFSFTTDPVRLKQVFNNLITNAFKNTSVGFVEFGVKLIDTEKHRIIFYVGDTGLGIPEESRNIIFERFIQLRDKGPVAVAGTGLGLSITKGILNLMNGDIWLESEVGKGTTFYFSLPYNQ